MGKNALFSHPNLNPPPAATAMDTKINPELTPNTYTELMNTVAYIENSPLALEAIKIAHDYAAAEVLAVGNRSPKYPILFTSAHTDSSYEKLAFSCVFWGTRKHKIAAKKGELYQEDKLFDFKDEMLDRYPHQFYAFFICRGFLIPRITEPKLPLYNGVEYPEETGENASDEDGNDGEWDIKSVRNVVFHDALDISPAIMLLIDWEVPNNKGLWAEKPNAKSVLSWVSIPQLGNYSAFVQYLAYRCETVEGTTKSFKGIAKPYKTEKDDYMSRHTSKK